MSVRTQFLNPLVALDDRTLLTRFTDQRDQSAFEQIVKRHGRLVFGVCRRVVRDAHLAEDAFQAVFLVLARAPQRAAEATSVGGWLFGTARRVGLAARRQEQRRERRELRAGAPESGSGAPGSDFNDWLCVLDEELSALPDELRAALVACFLEERTQDEAARELGWSLSTLRRRLERGKELLHERLARRGVALGAGLLAGALGAPARAAVPTLKASPASTALANELLKRGFGLKVSVLVTVTAAVVAVGGLAGGFTGQPPSPSAVAPGSKPTSAREAERVPAPHTTELARATVAGRVVLRKGREVPWPELVPEGQIKDANRWKRFGPVTFERTLVDPDTRGIANLMVWLRPDADDPRAAFPPDRIPAGLRDPKPTEHTVRAVAAQFRPRVLAVRAGDTVTFENRLEVTTNVRYFAPDADTDRGFNVMLPHDAAHGGKPVPVDRAPDAFTSTVHNWMQGYVRAFDHPYFAVTDANGRFELRDAPAGTWRLVVWHETAGYLGGAGGRLGTKLTVPETQTGKHELDAVEFASDRWPGP